MGLRQQKGLGKTMGPSFTSIQVAAKEQAKRAVTRIRKECEFWWQFLRGYYP